MKLFNLQNKLVTVKHKISKQEFVSMNVPKEEFENVVKSHIYQQLVNFVMKQFNIKTIPDGDSVLFEGSGYVLNERDMLNVLLEVCQLDEVTKKNFEESLMKQLGIR